LHVAAFLVRRLKFRAAAHIDFHHRLHCMGATQMASSGTIRPLYGVIIRDKCKSADKDTLVAYKKVAHDLLKDYSGADADDLKSAVKELDQAIAAKK
jgi:hypothetical protein